MTNDLQRLSSDNLGLKSKKATNWQTPEKKFNGAARQYYKKQMYMKEKSEINKIKTKLNSASAVISQEQISLKE